MSQKPDDDMVVVSLRIPPSMRAAIEDWTNEAGFERPSEAMRVLLEAGLSAHERGVVDVERLEMIQANATSAALGAMYEILAEVVDRMTKR